jgi:hypothetical protein
MNLPAGIGTTPLYLAAENGHLAVVRYIIEELGVNVDQSEKGGATPLIIAACMKHKKVIAYFLKHGADPHFSIPKYGTAVDVSKASGAPYNLIAYLEAKTHCSNPRCVGAGIKKCTGCKQARYCRKQCQLAHWPAHKADCKAAIKSKDARVV